MTYDQVPAVVREALAAANAHDTTFAVHEAKIRLMRITA